MASPKQLCRWLVSGLLAAGLCACASYKAAPLTAADVDLALAEPGHAELARKTAALRHALIQPLVLDFSGPLSLDAVSVVAVVANPDLAALRAQQQVAEAQVFASGLFPDPQLAFGVDRVLSPTDAGLVTAVAGGISVDVLGTLFTRHLEREAARRASSQLRLDIAWAEWNTAGNARLLAIRQHHLTRIDVLAKQAALTAARLLESVTVATARGDLKGDDLQAQRLAGVDATLRAATAGRQLEATRLELNHVLGLKPESRLAIAVPESGADSQRPSAPELFAAARRQRLDLQALTQGYASQEAVVRRAVLGQYPRVGLTINRARDTSAVQTWGPSVTLDLPLWNRNRGVIALAAASREVLRAEYVARLQQTRAEIAALSAALDADERTLASVRDEALKLTRLQGAYEAAAARGDLPRTAVDTASLAAIDKEIAVVGLEQSCAEERLGLALLTGDPFP